jgi:hypothetical protein
MRSLRIVVMLFTLASAPGAAATMLAAQGAAVETAAWRDRSADAWGRELRRQPMVKQALRGHGYNPNRISQAQERALGEAYRELFPERNARWDRLNRTQATALVYMALVHPGRSGSTGRQPRRSDCETVATQVWELEDSFAPAGRGQARHLNRTEREWLLAQAAEVQRSAHLCGDRRLEDAAHELNILLSEQRPDRERVTRQVSRMKSLVRLAMANLANGR